MESTHTQRLSDITRRAAPFCGYVLRSLREAELVPGHGEPPTVAHVANIVMALSAPTARSAPEHVRTLSALSQTSTTGLPPTAGAMLAALLIARRQGPVFVDFDIEDGFLHLGPTTVVLECLTLAGKRACVRYGTDPTGISQTTTIPLSVVAQFTSLIENP